MRWSVLAVAPLFVIVAGCKSGPAGPPAPKDAPSLLAGLQPRFEALGAPNSTQEYDVRQPAGIDALTAELKPYDPLLDEADGVLSFEKYGQVFGPASDLVVSPEAQATPTQKKPTQYLKFVKELTKGLVARARLRLAKAKNDLAFKDFEAAARICRFTGERPGSYLGLLVHLSCQAIVANALHHVSEDTSLDSAELHKFAAISAGLEDTPDWVAIINAEVAAGKRLPEANTAIGKKEFADDARALAIFKSSPSPAVADEKLRAWVGTGRYPTDPAEIKKASIGVLVAECLEQDLKGTANCRMTAAALEAMAADNGKNGPPRSIPKKYKTGDPFDPSGGPLTYGVTKEGFVISSLGGLKRFPKTPNLVSFTYPVKAYVPVRM